MRKRPLAEGWRKGQKCGLEKGKTETEGSVGLHTALGLSLDADEPRGRMMWPVLVRGKIDVWRLVQLEQVSSIIVLIEHLLDGRLRKVAHLKYHTHTHASIPRLNSRYVGSALRTRL